MFLLFSPFLYFFLLFILWEVSLKFSSNLSIEIVFLQVIILLVSKSPFFFSDFFFLKKLFNSTFFFWHKKSASAEFYCVVSIIGTLFLCHGCDSLSSFPEDTNFFEIFFCYLHCLFLLTFFFLIFFFPFGLALCFLCCRLSKNVWWSLSVRVSMVEKADSGGKGEAWCMED